MKVFSRLRRGIEAPSKRCQLLGLDLVRWVFDPDAMYIETGFLVWWRNFLVVHRRRHCCRVLAADLLGRANNDDVPNRYE